MKNIDILITHKNCADGKTCAIVALTYTHNNNLPTPKIIFSQYGETIEDFSIFKNKNIVIADFSYDIDTLNKIANIANSLVLIDHHISAINMINNAYDTNAINTDIKTHLDTTACGSALLYCWLHNTTIDTVPKLVQYVCDRDLWKWELPNSKEFSSGYAVLSYEDIVENGVEGFLDNDLIISELINMGKNILKSDNNYINKKANIDLICFTMGENNTIVPVLNNTHLISEVGNVIATKHNISCQYFITIDSIVFSLRSIGDYDVSAIAKYYGGGGHKNAAGFSFKLTDINLNKLFSDRNINDSIQANNHVN